MTDLHVELIGLEAGDDFALVVREAYELPEEVEDRPRADTERGGLQLLRRLRRRPSRPRPACSSSAARPAGSASAPPGRRSAGGAGRAALFAARIRHARELGLTQLVTETGERVPGRPSNSYRNIVRAGFRPAYVRPNFVSPVD